MSAVACHDVFKTANPHFAPIAGLLSLSLSSQVDASAWLCSFSFSRVVNPLVLKGGKHAKDVIST